MTRFFTNLFDVFPKFMYTLKIIIFGCCFSFRFAGEKCSAAAKQAKTSAAATFPSSFTPARVVVNNLLIEKINREAFLFAQCFNNSNQISRGSQADLNLRRDCANQFSFWKDALF